MGSRTAQSDYTLGQEKVQFTRNGADHVAFWPVGSIGCSDSGPIFIDAGHGLRVELLFCGYARMRASDGISNALLERCRRTLVWLFVPATGGFWVPQPSLTRSRKWPSEALVLSTAESGQQNSSKSKE